MLSNESCPKLLTSQQFLNPQSAKCYFQFQPYVEIHFFFYYSFFGGEGGVELQFTQLILLSQAGILIIPGLTAWINMGEEILFTSWNTAVTDISSTYCYAYAKKSVSEPVLEMCTIFPTSRSERASTSPPPSPFTPMLLGVPARHIPSALTAGKEQLANSSCSPQSIWNNFLEQVHTSSIL